MADATYSVVDVSKMNTDSIYMPVPENNKKQLESVADGTHSMDILKSDGKNEASTHVWTTEDKIESMSNKRFICILVTLAVISVAAIAYFIFVKVNSETAVPVQLSSDGNDSALTMLYLQQLNHSLSSLSEKVEEIATSNLSALREQIQQNTLLIKSFNDSGFSMLLPAPSCAVLPPSSPSGYYWVRNSNGSAVRVYCDMTRSCGGVTGGWMRVAELNMTDSSQQCPSGLTQNVTGNLRTCVRSSGSDGCSSVTLPTSGIHYSSVCGRIIAYQVGATNAFEGDSISSAYVDGVSLTHGNPRQHIWTFAAALSRQVSFPGLHYCPCITSA